MPTRARASAASSAAAHAAASTAAVASSARPVSSALSKAANRRALEKALFDFTSDDSAGQAATDKTKPAKNPVASRDTNRAALKPAPAAATAAAAVESETKADTVDTVPALDLTSCSAPQACETLAPTSAAPAPVRRAPLRPLLRLRCFIYLLVPKQGGAQTAPLEHEAELELMGETESSSRSETVSLSALRLAFQRTRVSDLCAVIERVIARPHFHLCYGTSVLQSTLTLEQAFPTLITKFLQSLSASASAQRGGCSKADGLLSLPLCSPPPVFLTCVPMSAEQASCACSRCKENARAVAGRLVKLHTKKIFAAQSARRSKLQTQEPQADTNLQASNQQTNSDTSSLPVIEGSHVCAAAGDACPEGSAHVLDPDCKDCLDAASCCSSVVCDDPACLVDSASNSECSDDCPSDCSGPARPLCGQRNDNCADECEAPECAAVAATCSSSSSSSSSSASDCSGSDSECLECTLEASRTTKQQQQQHQTPEDPCLDCCAEGSNTCPAPPPCMLCASACPGPVPPLLLPRACRSCGDLNCGSFFEHRPVRHTHTAHRPLHSSRSGFAGDHSQPTTCLSWIRTLHLPSKPHAQTTATGDANEECAQCEREAQAREATNDTNQQQQQQSQQEQQPAPETAATSNDCLFCNEAPSTSDCASTLSLAPADPLASVPVSSVAELPAACPAATDDADEQAASSPVVPADASSSPPSPARLDTNDEAESPRVATQTVIDGCEPHSGHQHVQQEQQQQQEQQHQQQREQHQEQQQPRSMIPLAATNDSQEFVQPPTAPPSAKPRSQLPLKIAREFVPQQQQQLQQQQQQLQQASFPAPRASTHVHTHGASLPSCSGGVIAGRVPRSCVSPVPGTDSLYLSSDVVRQLTQIRRDFTHQLSQLKQAMRKEMEAWKISVEQQAHARVDGVMQQMQRMQDRMERMEAAQRTQTVAHRQVGPPVIVPSLPLSLDASTHSSFPSSLHEANLPLDPAVAAALDAELASSAAHPHPESELHADLFHLPSFLAPSSEPVASGIMETEARPAVELLSPAPIVADSHAESAVRRALGSPFEIKLVHEAHTHRHDDSIHRERAGHTGSAGHTRDTHVHTHTHGPGCGSVVSTLHAGSSLVHHHLSHTHGGCGVIGHPVMHRHHARAAPVLSNACLVHAHATGGAQHEAPRRTTHCNHTH